MEIARKIINTLEKSPAPMLQQGSKKITGVTNVSITTPYIGRGSEHSMNGGVIVLRTGVYK